MSRLGDLFEPCKHFLAGQVEASCRIYKEIERGWADRECDDFDSGERGAGEDGFEELFAFRLG